MTEDSTPVQTEDITQLARLHRMTMPLSVLGRLGEGALERYYRWVAVSESEQLFISREDRLVVGAAVLSVRPATLIRRFVAADPLAFARDAAKAFAVDREFRADVRAFLSGSGAKSPLEMPEVLQIFVAPQHQGQHAGSRLLDRVEIWLKHHGVSRYCVRTLVEDNQPTLAFYNRRGFQTAGESIFCGLRYHVLEKAVC
jgi:GNAT superfamily N-acetyltransferase